jgi:hypothetical protein
MNTAANLLVILTFLAAFYTFLGLLCGIAEWAGALAARPHQRRRERRSYRRRTPRRAQADLRNRAGAQRPRGVTSRETESSTRPLAPGTATT